MRNRFLSSYRVVAAGFALAGMLGSASGCAPVKKAGKDLVQSARRELCIDRPKPAEPSEFEVAPNLVYTVHGGHELHADVYRPRNPTRRLPTVILVHGGGWRTGNKEALADTARVLVREGFAAIAIQYRLATDVETRFPAAVEDVRCAVQWTRGHADQYGLDGRQIALLGGSAGGHLAALVGVTGRSEEFANPDCPDGNQSAEVRGVISLAGPQDFTTGESLSNEQDRALVGFLGVRPDEDPALARRASPIAYVTPHSPAFLFLHGDHDTLVPISQSKRMLRALKNVHVHAELQTLKGVGHEMSKGLKPFEAWKGYCELRDFLDDMSDHLD